MATLAVAGGLRIGINSPSDLTSAAVLADEPGGEQRKSDREAIRKLVKDFLAALEGGDAKSVAALFTEEGEYVPEGGRSIHGRAAITKAYTKFMTENQSLKAKGNIESFRFLSENNAMIDGTARVKRGSALQPRSCSFEMLVTREKDRWLLAMLAEKPEDDASLDDLEWIIGKWAAKTPFAEIHTTYSWDENKNFIMVEFSIKQGNQTVRGTERIGEDPRTSRIRSWLFGNDGGFGEASWEWDGKRWVQEAEGVQSDGSVLKAVNLLTPLDKDSFIWQSVERSLDGEQIPNTPPVKVGRVK
jgi:uncharacterized protein (TIGR02246 family)